MSAPMIAWEPVVRRLYKYATTWDFSSYKTIKLPPVEVHDVEALPEKRARTLKHLLKANHINHAILYHNLEFTNHMPHILCSAYLLGAHEDQLHYIFDNESKELEEWKDSPAEMDEHDWRNYLGKREFQRAFVDFFEDELALKHDYDWRVVAREFLFEGKEPLINCAISNFGHPLIHLGYAFEMNSRELAMEALGMFASEYSYLHKYSDDAMYTQPSPNPSTSLLDLLARIHTDTRLDGLFSHPGSSNVHTLFTSHEALLMEYWNAWSLSDPLKQFEDSQEAAVTLLTQTVSKDKPEYDFFLCHVLTTSHAVRILLPNIPAKHHISVVRQWWLLVLAMYIAQLRPAIRNSLKDDVDAEVAAKGWKYVEHQALTGEYRTDSHFVKAVRALREAARTWGDADERYLCAAVRFVDTFAGWNGFGARKESH